MKIQLTEFCMAYQDQGSGIPVLLIHGYPLNSAMWEPQLTDLADCARLIAPDLRGHGNSEDVDGAYTMEAHAQDCNELLEKLGVQRKVIICGLSMGGYIALAFYRLFPDKVTGLVLTSTRAAADSFEAKANRDESIKLAQEQGIQAIVKGMAPRLLSASTRASKPQLVNQLGELMMHNSLRAVQGDLLGMKVRINSIPLLPEIRVPVQIIHGADDDIVPLDEAVRMQALIPGAGLCLIHHAAHLPNLEQPKYFNKCMREFLKQWKP